MELKDFHPPCGKEIQKDIKNLWSFANHLRGCQRCRQALPPSLRQQVVDRYQDKMDLGFLDNPPRQQQGQGPPPETEEGPGQEPPTKGEEPKEDNLNSLIENSPALQQVREDQQEMREAMRGMTKAVKLMNGKVNQVVTSLSSSAGKEQKQEGEQNQPAGQEQADEQAQTSGGGSPSAQQQQGGQGRLQTPDQVKQAEKFVAQEKKRMGMSGQGAQTGAQAGGATGGMTGARNMVDQGGDLARGIRDIIDAIRGKPRPEEVAPPPPTPENLVQEILLSAVKKKDPAEYIIRGLELGTSLSQNTLNNLAKLLTSGKATAPVRGEESSEETTRKKPEKHVE